MEGFESTLIIIILPFFCPARPKIKRYTVYLYL